MLLENPYEQNRSVYDPHGHFRYRQMKYVPTLLYFSHPLTFSKTCVRGEPRLVCTMGPSNSH